MRAFRVAYDGRPFHGFQRQPTVSTVEDTIFDALRALDVLDVDANKPPNYAAAGRTDAGVSAVAQTIAFESPEWLTPSALNSELPAAVRAWASADVPTDFHATHDAASRTYTYHLYAPDADTGLAREALTALSDEGDFHNLTPDDCGTVRTLDGRLERDGDFLVITLCAGGFPRQLVRRVITFVRNVATGTVPFSKIEQVLSPEPLSGPEGIGPASAAPLVLTAVEYPNLDFRVDAEAAKSAREVFEEVRIEAATRTRIAGDIENRIS